MKKILKNICIIDECFDVEGLHSKEKSDLIILSTQIYETPYFKSDLDMLSYIHNELLHNFHRFLFNKHTKIFLQKLDIKKIIVNKETNYEYFLIQGIYKLILYIERDSVQEANYRIDVQQEYKKVNKNSNNTDIIEYFSLLGYAKDFQSKIDILNKKSLHQNINIIKKIHSNSFLDFYLNFDINIQPKSYYNFIIKDTIAISLEREEHLIDEIEKIKSNTDLNYFQIIDHEFEFIPIGVTSDSRYNFNIEVGLAIDMKNSDYELFKKYKEINKESILKDIKYLSSLKRKLKIRNNYLIFKQEHIGHSVLFLGILTSILLPFFVL
jgi:hypothetical protein